MKRLLSPSLFCFGTKSLASCSSSSSSSSCSSSGQYAVTGLKGIHLLSRAAAAAGSSSLSWGASPSSSIPWCAHDSPSTSTSTSSGLLRQAATAALALHKPLAGSLVPWVRFLSTTQASLQQPKPSEKSSREFYDSLEITPEKIDNAITDRIPERPVGVVEGTSYSLIIIAALAALIFVLYQFVMNFILEPTALQCFTNTLDMLKADPRITVRLGSPDDIRAWGSNSQSRVGRQQIPHQIYQDANGVEHVRIQFYMRGPSGTGLVNADMYKEPTTKSWQYTYLLVDTYTNSSQTPSRVHIVRPQ